MAPPPEGFAYGGPTVLQNRFVIEIVLPFILVFTIVFAVLQKSEIFGKGKKQIDALVALVVALLFVSVARAVGIVLDLIPILAVGLVVVLVLMLFLGSFAKEGDFEKAFPKWLRLGLMIVAIITVVVATLWATGLWNTFMDYIKTSTGSSVLMNIILLAVLIGAVIAVIWKGGSGGGKDNK